MYGRSLTALYARNTNQFGGRPRSHASIFVRLNLMPLSSTCGRSRCAYSPSDELPRSFLSNLPNSGAEKTADRATHLHHNPS